MVAIEYAKNEKFELLREHFLPHFNAPIGFAKVYLYYVLPDKKRPRISQVLILPPYQRIGHGRRLLTAIYNDFRKDSRIQDITAEDPSANFIALRDLVSLELCHKYLRDLFAKESILKIERLTKAMIDKAREVCKLTKRQTQRVYEMRLLESINKNNEEEMKKFRLIVKQHLFESFQFDKSDLSVSDPGARKAFLTRQYEFTCNQYENISRSFDKYHMRSFFITDMLTR